MSNGIVDLWCELLPQTGQLDDPVVWDCLLGGGTHDIFENAVRITNSLRIINNITILQNNQMVDNIKKDCFCSQKTS